jgi:hypothetical protein
MQPVSAMQWLFKCALGAAAVLIACAAATAWFGNGLQLPATTSRDGALITLNRYVREPVPDIVLVGSSLSFRLKEEYFSTPRLRNLALAGGSPVTGLEIIANAPRLPRIILAETNVLSRPPDTTLIERYARRADSDPLFFRPIRTAVAAYENWLHAPLTHEQVSLALGRLLRQPPGSFDNHIYVERALQQMNADDPTAAVRMNITRIKELIAALEPRGARLLLLEVPYSEPIERSRAASISRELVHAEFPDRNRWLRIDPPRSELRWADGVHLDERSAVIVTQSIERALAELSAAP